MGRSPVCLVGQLVGRVGVLRGVVDERGGEEAVGPFLGELARVGEDDGDGGVADLEASYELEQPAGRACSLLSSAP
jgi:hypothetical protein